MSSKKSKAETKKTAQSKRGRDERAKAPVVESDDELQILESYTHEDSGEDENPEEEVPSGDENDFPDSFVPSESSGEEEEEDAEPTNSRLGDVKTWITPVTKKGTNLADDSDSSDDEGQKNRIGNVPIQWYDNYDHIGYDVKGKKIIRKPRGDGIDKFLARKDDPDYG